MNVNEFQQLIRLKGHELYRDMPWRQDTRPYYILVSELMLQQTQVSRVIPKFEQFIAAFPDTAALARASLADVLTFWQGLGYNRRAKFLHLSAQRVMDEYGGVFPESEKALCTLPGVGKNTAGALRAYAFNQPALFVETNVRTVYIYHLFPDQDTVSDDEVLSALRETIDQENPREWYWALMDYGSHLKSQGVRTNARSAHYTKQSPLEGSVRQVRGRILKQLTSTGPQSEVALRVAIVADERYEQALSGLVRDGLVEVSGENVRLRV